MASLQSIQGTRYMHNSFLPVLYSQHSSHNCHFSQPGKHRELKKLFILLAKARVSTVRLTIIIVNIVVINKTGI